MEMAQQGRRHVSDGAMSIYAGKWKVSACSVETDLADAGLVMMTVAEVEAMELRSRDRQIQDCAVADLCAQVRDAETERDTLRAQLAEEREEHRATIYEAALLRAEIERLRGAGPAIATVEEGIEYLRQKGTPLKDGWLVRERLERLRGGSSAIERAEMILGARLSDALLLTQLCDEIERLRGGKKLSYTPTPDHIEQLRSVLPPDGRKPQLGGLLLTPCGLDHRLGLGPQPATETVEPMSAQSWKRRMGE